MLQNFMAAKLKGNLFVLLRDARLISITKHLSVLRFSAEKKIHFGFNSGLVDLITSGRLSVAESFS